MSARIEITLEPDGPPVVHGHGERDELRAWLRRDERARHWAPSRTASRRLSANPVVAAELLDSVRGSGPLSASERARNVLERVDDLVERRRSERG